MNGSRIAKKEIYRGWAIETDWQEEGWSFSIFSPNDESGETDGKVYPRRSSAIVAARRFIIQLSASVALMQFLDDAYESGVIGYEEKWILLDSLP